MRQSIPNGVDPTIAYLLAAMAHVHVETAVKALCQGVQSLRPMTRARVQPAMERLGLLPLEPDGGKP